MDTQTLNDRQHRKGRQVKQARLEIVAELYKRGKSIRQIAKEVRDRLQLEKTPSSQTIFADIQILLAEWREYRIENTDELIQLELERIDDAIVELWEAWNKSKQDYEQSSKKQTVTPTKGVNNQSDTNKKMDINYLEQQRKEIRKYGDVSYIAEIRQQLQERRKLLGLYAPEKREHTGKDGLPLNPPQAGKINVDDLTEEELSVLYNIAAKRDKTKQ